MGETKPVVCFTDDRKPNSFFFRSPFRSWKFLINTLLLAVVVLAYAIVAWKFMGVTGSLSLATLMLLDVIYPYWGALLRHRKINELYQAGKITVQGVESPIDDLLEVADNALNEGLRNSSVVFGILLLIVALWQGHLK